MASNAFYLHMGGRPRPRLLRHEISGAPAFLDGMRVLFASDFHVRAHHSDRAIRAISDAAAAEEPDLILLGGDYAEGVRALAKFVRASDFSAPLGVYAVRGNNDHVRGGAPRLKKQLAQCGAKLLLNGSARIPLPGGELEIIGIDDHLKGHPDEKRAFSRQNGGDYRIFLSHFPILPEEEEPDLMLSGHTHGGQIRLFGLDPYSTGLERKHLSRKLSPAAIKKIGYPLAVAGQGKTGKTDWIVSRGIGMSRLEIRLGCPAEMHLITFRA